MDLSRRGFFAAGAIAAAAVPALAVAQETAKPAATTNAATAPAATTSAAPAAPGQITEEQLDKLLKAMGLKPEKVDKRYDFVFRSVYNKEDWDLSMTAVLSADGRSIWIMAWLDEMPKSATDVPRTSLLRLLAANDRLGNGKFFAYVASNRRFVLQRVMPNENISTKMFRDSLQDLGTAVVESYPYWSVANWSEKPATGTSPASTAAAPGNSSDQGVQQSQPGLQGAGKTPTRTASGTNTATGTTTKGTTIK